MPLIVTKLQSMPLVVTIDIYIESTTQGATPYLTPSGKPFEAGTRGTVSIVDHLDKRNVFTARD
jgi:hypothetical protein